MTVYVGKNVSVVITKTTSGDMGAFVAQEVTFEPKQAVEGLDALGSDTIQEWAPLLKTFEGSLKEPLLVGDNGETQMDRLAAFQASLEEYTVELKFEHVSGDIAITLTGTVFSEPSISSPKNAPAFVTTRFKAKSASVATS